MDKPYLTFQEQITKLRNEYSLIINDEDFALESLISLSYYDLINGYQIIYQRNGTYIDGTSIEKLVATHFFNKNIQGVLMKYSTYVENSFKNILANTIAHHFSEHQDNYLNIYKYKRKRTPDQRQKLENLICQLKHNCESCKDTPTAYYIENKNHIPPWILFRNTSFSDTTDLFSFLYKVQKEEFTGHIKIFANHNLDYNSSSEIILDAAHLVRRFRNKIAHNLDFLTFRSAHLSKKANILFNGSLSTSEELNKTRTDVWGMILAIIILLNNKFMVHNFLAELLSYLNYDDSVLEEYCEVTGIPLDYERRIETYLEVLNLQAE